MSSQRRTVVGFDGSTDAWVAARYAAAEAAAEGGQVRLVHALLDRATYATLMLPDLTADAQAEAHRLVAVARAELVEERPGLDVQTLVVDRAAGPTLVRVSRSAGLIVLGRRGHGRAPAGAPAGGAFQRIHVGSVAAHVMAYASGPVVVVGPGGRDIGGGPVVLGLNAAAPSESAISYAFQAAQRRGTSLHVCYVRTPTAGPVPGRMGDPEEDADSRLLLSQAMSGWRATHADVPVSLDVLHGFDPAARLLDAAATAALVVVGTRERPGAPRTAPAGVPDTLVRNATCPVAVVRPHHRAELHRAEPRQTVAG